MFVLKFEVIFANKLTYYIEKERESDRESEREWEWVRESERERVSESERKRKRESERESCWHPKDTFLGEIPIRKFYMTHQNIVLKRLREKFWKVPTKYLNGR